jgi:hypothetical protein
MNKKILGYIAIFLLVLLAACSSSAVNAIVSSPESTAKTFMRAMDKGNPDKALDKICESFAMVKLPSGFLRDDRYQTVYADDFQATVNVKGEIRVKSDIGSAKKMLDFDLELENREFGWCILRDSMLNLLDSLSDLSY